jgi:hypothetical protein
LGCGRGLRGLAILQDEEAAVLGSSIEGGYYS